MIINLRGTHGAGKTSISRRLIDEHPHTPIHAPNYRTDNDKKPVAWKIGEDLFVVGRYQVGCDGIRHDPLCALVRAFAQRGHVLFENVLVSANAGRWLKLRQEVPDEQWLWAVLDTPVDLCIERVYLRRAEAKARGFNHRQEFIKEDVLRQHHRRVWRSKELLEEQGEVTLWIDHARAYEQVHDLLTGAGWICPGHLEPDPRCDHANGGCAFAT